MTFKERLERFMAQIKKQESSGRATVQHPTSKAYGYYQFMPEVWETLWKKRGVEDANANANVPPLQWVPTPTPEAQEDLARWQFTRLFRRFDDERRVAADWRSGKGEYDPQAKDSEGKYQWTDGTMKYVNSATVPLGFEPTTRETRIPALPDAAGRLQFDIVLLEEELDEQRRVNASLNNDLALSLVEIEALNNELDGAKADREEWYNAYQASYARLTELENGIRAWRKLSNSVPDVP